MIYICPRLTVHQYDRVLTLVTEQVSFLVSINAPVFPSIALRGPYSDVLSKYVEL